MNCPICHITLEDTNYLRSHLTVNHSEFQLQHSLRKCPDVPPPSPSRAKVGFEFAQVTKELLLQLNNARQLHSQNLLSQRRALRTLSKGLSPSTEASSQRQHEDRASVISGQSPEQHAICRPTSPNTGEYRGVTAGSALSTGGGDITTRGTSKQRRMVESRSRLHRTVTSAPCEGTGLFRESCNQCPDGSLLPRRCLASSTPVPGFSDWVRPVGMSKYQRGMKRLEEDLMEKSSQVAELTQRLKEEVKELETQNMLITSVRCFHQRMKKEGPRNGTPGESHSPEHFIENSRTDQDNSGPPYPGAHVSVLRNEMHNLHLDGVLLDHDEKHKSSTQEQSTLFANPYGPLSRTESTDVLARRPRVPSSPGGHLPHTEANLRRSDKLGTDMMKKRVHSPSLSSISGESRSSSFQRPNKNVYHSGKDRSTRKPRKNQKRVDRKREEFNGVDEYCDASHQLAGNRSSQRQVGWEKTQNGYAEEVDGKCGASTQSSGISSHRDTRCEGGEDPTMNGDCGASDDSNGSDSQSSKGQYNPEIEWLLHQQQLLELEFNQELMNLLDHIDRMHHRAGIDKK